MIELITVRRVDGRYQGFFYSGTLGREIAYTKLSFATPSEAVTFYKSREPQAKVKVDVK